MPLTRLWFCSTAPTGGGPTTVVIGPGAVVGTVVDATIVGQVTPAPAIVGTVVQPDIIGVVTTAPSVDGEVIDPTIEGEVR